jgi:hypothetical protein
MTAHAETHVSLDQVPGQASEESTQFVDDDNSDLKAVCAQILSDTHRAIEMKAEQLAQERADRGDHDSSPLKQEADWLFAEDLLCEEIKQIEQELVQHAGVAKSIA